MVARLSDWSNEMLRVLFDHTPAVCFWAKKLRFMATVNISSDESLRAATIPQENKKSFARKSVFEKFLLLELSGGKNVFGKELTQES